MLTSAQDKSDVYFSIDTQPFQARLDEAPAHGLNVHAQSFDVNIVFVMTILNLYGVFERAKQKAGAIRHGDNKLNRE
jgi:hypothetical protein